MLGALYGALYAQAPTLASQNEGRRPVFGELEGGGGRRLQSTVCADTDNGALDGYSAAPGGCESYDAYPSACGGYDDSDFSSNSMCCTCGGGELVAAPPPSPGFPPVPPTDSPSTCKAIPELLQCAPGTAPDATGTCAPCDPGTYGPGGQYCAPCRTGSYQPEAGQTECITCGVGRSFLPAADGSAVVGQADDSLCVDCGPGTSGSVGSSCYPCEVGKWSTGQANFECTFCQNALDTAQTYLDAAAAGCPDGDADLCDRAVDYSAFCFTCPVGQGPHRYDGGLAPAAGVAYSPNGFQKGEAGTQCNWCAGPSTNAVTGSTTTQNQWHGPESDVDACSFCPPNSFLNAEAQADFDTNRTLASMTDYDVDVHCTSDCEALYPGTGTVLSPLWGECVKVPPWIQVVPGELKDMYYAECEPGEVPNITNATGLDTAAPTYIEWHCEACAAGTYALPGAEKCTPCPEGYTSEAMAQGCTPLEAAPACDGGDVAVPAVADYDCVTSFTNNGHSDVGFGGGDGFSGCYNLFGALFNFGADYMLVYANSYKRLCPKTIEYFADNWQYSSPAFGDDKAATEYALRQIVATAVAEWGLNDEAFIQSMFESNQGINILSWGLIHPVQMGCVDLDDVYAAGTGLVGTVTPLVEEFVAEGNVCYPTSCNDLKFEDSWCSYPLFAIGCPVKCGYVPASTIMCAETGAYILAALKKLPITVDWSEPIQPASMVNCGPGWKVDCVTKLVVPACGKTAELAYCPDSKFEAEIHDGLYYPHCHQAPSPEGSTCDPDEHDPCDAGLACTCTSRRDRKLLFSSLPETCTCQPADAEVDLYRTYDAGCA